MAANARPFTRRGIGAVGGLSLVELLIAMLLGVSLSAGVVSVYLGSKQNYFYEEQAARLQENGRYAMQILQRELAMAGFFGGVLTMDTVRPAEVDIDCSDAQWALAGGRPVELVNDFSGPPAPVSSGFTVFTCLDAADIEPFTDVLAVRRTAADASLRRGVPAPGLTASTVQQWYLRLTGNGDPQWQQLRSTQLHDAGKAGSRLSYWEAISRVFYIRKFSDSGSHSGQANDGIPTLCMENLAGDGMTTRCLIEGVENMQFEFGIDTDNDGVANRYQAAPEGAEIDRAVTAKVYLLLRSIFEITGYRDQRTYTLGQREIAAGGDGYLRRVFTTTVQLRNRIEPIT